MSTQSQNIQQIRRTIKSLKQTNKVTRKNAMNELNKIMTSQQLTKQIISQLFDNHFKQILKCYADQLEAVRQGAVNLSIKVITLCGNFKTILPYLLQVLKDRTNCVDLEGVDRLPQKMKPQPGQKPKMLIKIVQNCEQIRILYCQLIKLVITLLEQQDRQLTVKYLDDLINILRALLMDPNSDIQLQACNTLSVFCKDFRSILLHFTQTLGKAILLPLINKKSKNRIAALNVLTQVLWCGLWKYNAFVFQDLIGFRDPNSVPIKDFYQPTNNVNYLATFIVDPNAKVRQQFMRNIKIWVCDLNDKFDHHGKLVPYLLSGLFDSDEQVQQYALSAIDEIGKQIQQQKQKQFRQNKQYAIDAAWTWEGQLIQLELDQPIKKRPSLGSRYFIRGHVRKFWTALYKEIRDLKQENRLRSASLCLYAVIYSQNYLAQFLDNMVPQLLPSILPSQQSSDIKVSQKVCRIFYYIGRFCEQSAYLHLMKSALQGELIQNQMFVKSAMKALSMLAKGNFQAIPSDKSLEHKKKDLIELLNMFQQCKLADEVYHFNCAIAQDIVKEITNVLIKKASKEQINQIFETHLTTVLKLLSVCCFELTFGQNQSFDSFFETSKTIDNLFNTFSEGNLKIQNYLQKVQQSLPSAIDSNWKFLVVLFTYYHNKQTLTLQQQNNFKKVCTIISKCIQQHQSIDLLSFCLSFLQKILIITPLQTTYLHVQKTTDLLKDCLKVFLKFRPKKKQAIYERTERLNQAAEQIQQKPKTEDIFLYEEKYSNVFESCSKSFSTLFINNVSVPHSKLAKLLSLYIGCSKKCRKNKNMRLQSIKTIWAIFQKVKISQNFSEGLKFSQVQEQKPIYCLHLVIDFCIQNLQDEISEKQTAFVFAIFKHCISAWPTLTKITSQQTKSKMKSVYIQFPELIEKLLKYCLNERNIQNRQKYIQVLQEISKKVPDWIKMQLNVSRNQQRFQRAKLIQEVISGANI